MIRAESPATRAVVLVLHGGKPRSHAPSRPWHLSRLRIAWLARSLRTALGPYGAEVRMVRYRYRGWNAPDADPLRDARAAVHRLRDGSPDLPLILVGHSMGGRAAVHLASAEAVRGVIALAPWWPVDDARAAPPATRLFAVHGTSDTWTDPRESRRQVDDARERGVDATWIPVQAGGHSMLTHPRMWHRLTAELAATLLADAQIPAEKTGRFDDA